MKKKLTLGTRSSLLALAQTREISAFLKAAHPDLEIEVVKMDSFGDQNREKPLYEFNEVGIFTKGVDEHVLSGDIDCAIHCFKDLGTQRPAGLVTAAIPPRADSRDIIFYRADVLEKLARGEKLTLGSSAPRRMALIPPFLAKALPKLNGHTPQVEVVPIRGNVNTRLGFLTIPRDDEKALDGVVLATAGISRLYADKESRPTLAPLLDDLLHQVMPLTVCPGAPGQGALCIETHADNTFALDMLKACNDPTTAAAVANEHKILKEHGGGCHQQFGVYTFLLGGIDAPITLVQGLNEQNEDISEWRTPEIPNYTWWNGREWRDQLVQQTDIDVAIDSTLTTFAASARAVPTDAKLSQRLWTSGVAGWEKLAARGYWVEGCADGLGHDFIEELLADPFLQLPSPEDWQILTHQDATSDWPDQQVAGTYRIDYQPTAAAVESLASAEAIYWSSGSQFVALQRYAKSAKIHACGPGKTRNIIKAHGIEPMVMVTPPSSK